MIIRKRVSCGYGYCPGNQQHTYLIMAEGIFIFYFQIDNNTNIYYVDASMLLNVYYSKGNKAKGFHRIFFYSLLLYKHVKTVVQIDVYGKSINFIFKKCIYTVHINSNILYITEDICITGCSDQLFT